MISQFLYRQRHSSTGATKSGRNHEQSCRRGQTLIALGVELGNTAVVWLIREKSSANRNESKVGRSVQKGSQLLGHMFRRTHASTIAGSTGKQAGDDPGGGGRDTGQSLLLGGVSCWVWSQTDYWPKSTLIQHCQEQLSVLHLPWASPGAELAVLCKAQLSSCNRARWQQTEQPRGHLPTWHVWVQELQMVLACMLHFPISPNPSKASQACLTTEPGRPRAGKDQIFQLCFKRVTTSADNSCA